MFKFLHLADVHFDAPHISREERLGRRLKEGLQDAFERAITCALEEKVHAVLIAGDLFDHERLSIATESFLLTQLARLAESNIPCVYVTGNHDPGHTQRQRRPIAWPEVLQLVDTAEPQTIQVTDAEGSPVGQVVAAGHATAREGNNLVGAFPSGNGALPHVGLLHAQVTSANGVDSHDRYAPCTIQDLQGTEYDYWALGHVHIRQEVCNRAHAWYCGSLQGCHPLETGAKGGLLVSAQRGQPPTVTPQDFAPIRWEHLHIDDLPELHTLTDFRHHVRDVFHQQTDGAPDHTDWLVRISLEGATPLFEELTDEEQLEDLEQDLREHLGALHAEIRAHYITRPVNVDEAREETTVLAELLDLIERAESDDSLLEELAPETLAGHSSEEARLEYLRGLLPTLDREAAARFLST